MLHGEQMTETVVFVPYPYAMPVVAVGLVVLMLGLGVLTREGGSSRGWRFFGLTTTISGYLIFAGLSYAAVSQETSLRLARSAHVFVGIIPAAIIWATTSVLDQVRRRLPWLITALAVSFVFSLLALFGRHFVSGNTPVFWGYYPTYGTAGLFFLVYFAAVMISIPVLYLSHLRRTTEPIRRKRLIGLMIAFAVGYFGAVDFLPAIGVDVYAFGYVPIMLFVVIMAFVALRYRLEDITPALAARQILRTMHDAVMVTDLHGTIQITNEAAARLFGRSMDSLTGQRVSGLLDVPESLMPEPHSSSAPSEHQTEVSSAGSTKSVSVAASVLEDRRGNRLGTVLVARDITDQKRAELELRRMALYDSLTQLPNRVLFFDRLDQLLALARRNQYTLAILYMDLDRFKEINDTLGHETGDALLVQVAHRMRTVTRSSDTIARMGGDEFIGVCGRISSPDDAKVVAGKLVDTLAEPFDIAGRQVSIGVSIGISVYPEHAEESRELLAKADQAMYTVKAGGSGGFLVYGS